MYLSFMHPCYFVYQDQCYEGIYSNTLVFHRAQQLDSSDHLAEYYLAFHYAQDYHVVEATHHVKQALFLRSEHLHSLHLLILLLSTKKEYEHALEVSSYSEEDAYRKLCFK